MQYFLPTSAMFVGASQFKSAALYGPANIAEVGKRYCIGVFKHKKTIEKCCIGGWCGTNNWVYDARDGCPPDTIQVKGKPACPNRSGRFDEFEVEKKLREYFDFSCDRFGDDAEHCRGMRAQLKSMLKIK